MEKNVDNLIFVILEKSVLELHRAATIDQDSESALVFLLGHNRHTQVYIQFLGPIDVWLRRNRNSPVDEDDYVPPSLPLLLLGLKVLYILEILNMVKILCPYSKCKYGLSSRG